MKRRFHLKDGIAWGQCTMEKAMENVQLECMELPGSVFEEHVLEKGDLDQYPAVVKRVLRPNAVRSVSMH